MGCTRLPTSLDGLRGKLSGQNSIAFFDSDTVARKLVVWGETSWMCRLGDPALVGHFSEGVYPVSIAIEGVHQMHVELCKIKLRDGWNF